MPTYGPEFEGRTAISKDGKTRIKIVNGEAVVDKSYHQPTGRAETTSDDRKALVEAQNRAAAERDAMRQYKTVGPAIERITSPAYASWLDAITPQPEGGVMDTIGGWLGAVPRWLTDDKNLEAMDQLNTVNAQAAIAASKDVKGAASDRDMTLMRMSGIGPYKTQTENRRLLNDAIYQSALEGLRANLTSKWIAAFGSLSAPGENGETFEEYLNKGEQLYSRNFKQNMRGGGGNRNSRLPKAPPKKKASGGPVTIDLEGNILQ